MGAVAQEPEELASGDGVDCSGAGAVGAFAVVFGTAVGVALALAAGLGAADLPGTAGIPKPAGEMGFWSSAAAGAGALAWGAGAAAGGCAGAGTVVPEALDPSGSSLSSN